MVNSLIIHLQLAFFPCLYHFSWSFTSVFWDHLPWKQCASWPLAQELLLGAPEPVLLALKVSDHLSVHPAEGQRCRWCVGWYKPSACCSSQTLGLLPVVYWGNTQTEGKTSAHAVTLALECVGAVMLIKIMEKDEFFILSSKCQRKRTGTVN